MFCVEEKPTENTGYEIKHIHHGKQQKRTMKEEVKRKECRIKRIKTTGKKRFSYLL